MPNSFETPWAITHQASLMGFPKQEYWSRLSFLYPVALFDTGIKTVTADSLSLSYQGSHGSDILLK